MRAIGLVLLSLAIMALLLTDADAQRRSSAQGSQAAGASRSWCAVHPRHGTENCGYTSFDQCWATAGSEGGWCRPNPFSATPYGTGYTWSGPKRYPGQSEIDNLLFRDLKSGGRVLHLSSNARRCQGYDNHQAHVFRLSG